MVRKMVHEINRYKRGVIAFIALLLVCVSVLCNRTLAWAAPSVTEDENAFVESNPSMYGDLVLTRSFDTPDYQVISDDGKEIGWERGDAAPGNDVEFVWRRGYYKSGNTYAVGAGVYVKFRVGKDETGNQSSSWLEDNHAHRFVSEKGPTQDEAISNTHGIVVRFPDMLMDMEGNFYDLEIYVANAHVYMNGPFAKGLREQDGSHTFWFPVFWMQDNGRCTNLQLGNHPSVIMKNNLADGVWYDHTADTHWAGGQDVPGATGYGIEATIRFFIPGYDNNLDPKKIRIYSNVVDQPAGHESFRNDMKNYGPIPGSADMYNTYISHYAGSQGTTANQQYYLNASSVVSTHFSNDGNRFYGNNATLTGGHHGILSLYNISNNGSTTISITAGAANRYHLQTPAAFLQTNAIEFHANGGTYSDVENYVNTTFSHDVSVTQGNQENWDSTILRQTGMPGMTLSLFTGVGTRNVDSSTDFGPAYKRIQNAKQPVREGYQFLGWNTQPDGSGMDYALHEIVEYSNLAQVVTGSSTPTLGQILPLYAKWKVSPYAYKAYAVLMDNGSLVFCRSNQDYVNGGRYSVVDIHGNTYEGKVYANIETMNINNASDVPWYGDRNRIRNVSVAPDTKIQPGDCDYLFSDCPNLTMIDLSGFDTGGEYHEGGGNHNPKKVTSMVSMFENCPCIDMLDLYSFDTKDVTNMSSMFKGCTNLSDVFLRSFNTEKVENMSSMFEGCSSLEKLDLRSFITEDVINNTGVKDFSSMFKDCTSLKSIDMRNMGARLANTMASMFENCTSLGSLDMSGIYTKANVNVSNMFKNCSELTTLDLSNFDTTSGTTTSMFDNDYKLAQITLGDNFRFKIARLPEAAAQSSNSNWFTGNWVKSDGTLPHNSTALASAFDANGTHAAHVGTWVWEPVSGVDGNGMLYYDPAGGIAKPSSVSDTMTATGIMNSALAERPGYIFKGWTYEANGEKKSFDGGTLINVRQIICEINGVTYNDSTGLWKGKIGVVTAEWEPEPPYTLGGAKYRIYNSEACDTNSYIGVEFSTDSNGDAGSINLPVGTYYIKERVPSNGYGLDPRVYKVVIRKNSSTGEIEVYNEFDEPGAGLVHVDSDTVTSREPIIYGDLQIEKLSTNTELTEGSTIYSMVGAEYTLYMEQSCQTIVKNKYNQDCVFTIGRSDVSDVIDDIRVGDYWLKETKAPLSGAFELDPEVRQVSVKSGRVSILQAYDDPTPPDSVNMMLSKQVATGGEMNKYFKFNLTLKNSDNTNIPNGTYGDVVVTNGTAMVQLKNSDYVRLTGLPIGVRYTITEVTPAGYSLSWQARPSESSVSGNSVSGQINDAFNYASFIAKNTPTFGGFAVEKKLTSSADEDLDRDYVFSATITDASNNPVTGTFTAVKTSGGTTISIPCQFVNGEWGFSLKKDEKITLSNIPVNYKYTVTESINDLPGGNNAWTIAWNNTPTGTIGLNTSPTFRCTNTRNSGKVRILKSSTSPGITNGNAFYSTVGVTYGVFETEADARAAIAQTTYDSSSGSYRKRAITPIVTLVAGSDGYSQVEEITPGTYYAVELSANTDMTGLKLDETGVYTLTVTKNGTTTLPVRDEIVGYKIKKAVQKVDGLTGIAAAQGSASLAGAVFKVEYYNQDYTDAQILNGSASVARTWYIRSDDSGMATLDDDHFIETGSSEVWRDTSGDIIIPRGIIKVTETEGSPGYLVPLSSSRIIHLLDNETLDDDLAKVDEEPFEQREELAKVYARKIDASTGEPLNGATFTITNGSTNSVRYNGRDYAPGEIMATMVSGTISEVLIPAGYDGNEGWVYLDSLPYGTYEFREIEAPENYILDTLTVSRVTIDDTTTTGVAVMEIENRPAAIALPSTGLDGMNTLELLGSAGAMVAGAYGYVKKRKKK